MPRRLSTEQSTILAVKAVSDSMDVNVPSNQRAAWKLLRGIKISTICDGVPEEFEDETLDVAGLALVVLASGDCPMVTTQLKRLWENATAFAEELWKCRNKDDEFPAEEFTQPDELSCATRITELAFFLRRAWG